MSRARIVASMAASRQRLQLCRRRGIVGSRHAPHREDASRPTGFHRPARISARMPPIWWNSRPLPLSSGTHESSLLIETPENSENRDREVSLKNLYKGLRAGGGGGGRGWCRLYIFFLMTTPTKQKEEQRLRVTLCKVVFPRGSATVGRGLANDTKHV